MCFDGSKERLCVVEPADSKEKIDTDEMVYICVLQQLVEKLFLALLHERTQQFAIQVEVTGVFGGLRFQMVQHCAQELQLVFVVPYVRVDPQYRCNQPLAQFGHFGDPVIIDPLSKLLSAFFAGGDAEQSPKDLRVTQLGSAIRTHESIEEQSTHSPVLLGTLKEGLLEGVG